MAFPFLAKSAHVLDLPVGTLRKPSLVLFPTVWAPDGRVFTAPGIVRSGTSAAPEILCLTLLHEVVGLVTLVAELGHRLQFKWSGCC